VQQYDLIVLQVGLNAVTNSLNNVRWYEAELERTFQHLKKCFPGKPILVVSVGDRGGKIGTELATMRGVPAIVQMQRSLARKHGLFFYDLFWGMGGPNTMIKFAYRRPRLANTDYTHLTHEGGKVVGGLFAKLFLQEQANWQAGRQAR
jgi:lysophospholipase L1-like esterase